MMMIRIKPVVIGGRDGVRAIAAIFNRGELAAVWFGRGDGAIRIRRRDDVDGLEFLGDGGGLSSESCRFVLLL